MTDKTGKINFAMVPKLPQDWKNGSDEDTVWPTWGRDTYYLWGANSGNQFVARGEPLDGGGMAGVDRGPSRGLGHPQFVGLDTMSFSAASQKANARVFGELSTRLKAGATVVVPVYMKERNPDNGKFGLGTGYGLDVADHAAIHADIWGHLLALINAVATVEIPDVMWTPDVTRNTSQDRKSNAVPLGDLAAVRRWHASLTARLAPATGTDA